MILRAIGTLLWFFVGWGGGSVLAVVIGTPAILGVAAGMAVAGLVWWDPAQKIWGPKLDRKVVRRRIADLQRVPPAPAGATPQPQLDPARD